MFEKENYEFSDKNKLYKIKKLELIEKILYAIIFI